MQPETEPELSTTTREASRPSGLDLFRKKRDALPRKNAKPRSDAANMDIIDAVIGIAIFAATIGLIGTQITSAGANLTAFPGAGTLLYLVPLILVAVLILRLWKGRGRARSRY